MALVKGSGGKSLPFKIMAILVLNLQQRTCHVVIFCQYPGIRAAPPINV